MKTEEELDDMAFEFYNKLRFHPTSRIEMVNCLADFGKLLLASSLPKEEPISKSLFEKMLTWVTDDIAKGLMIEEYNKLHKEEKQNVTPQENIKH